MISFPVIHCTPLDALLDSCHHAILGLPMAAPSLSVIPLLYIVIKMAVITIPNNLFRCDFVEPVNLLSSIHEVLFVTRWN